MRRARLLGPVLAVALLLGGATSAMAAPVTAVHPAIKVSRLQKALCVKATKGVAKGQQELARANERLPKLQTKVTQLQVAGKTKAAAAAQKDLTAATAALPKLQAALDTLSATAAKACATTTP